MFYKIVILMYLKDSNLVHYYKLKKLIKTVKIVEYLYKPYKYSMFLYRNFYSFEINVL